MVVPIIQMIGLAKGLLVWDSALLVAGYMSSRSVSHPLFVHLRCRQYHGRAHHSHGGTRQRHPRLGLGQSGDGIRQQQVSSRHVHRHRHLVPPRLRFNLRYFKNCVNILPLEKKPKKPPSNQRVSS